MVNFDNPPLERRHRRWWIGAAGLVLLLLAYSLFWFSVAINSRDAVVQWIDRQRANEFTGHIGLSFLDQSGIRQSRFWRSSSPLALELGRGNP
jgi:hypothetical protein